jgi:hypothetical protein
MVQAGIPRVDDRLVSERHDDIEGVPDVGSEEASRRDADNRERHALERQRAADGVRRAAEAPLPEAVADDRDRSIRAAAPHVVRRGERAADPRRDAEDLEERAARPHTVHELRFSAGGEIEASR